MNKCWARIEAFDWPDRGEVPAAVTEAFAELGYDLAAIGEEGTYDRICVYEHDGRRVLEVADTDMRGGIESFRDSGITAALREAGLEYVACDEGHPEFPAEREEWQPGDDEPRTRCIAADGQIALLARDLQRYESEGEGDAELVERVRAHFADRPVNAPAPTTAASDDPARAEVEALNP